MRIAIIQIKCRACRPSIGSKTGLLLAIVILLCLVETGCKKFTEVNAPYNQLSSADIFSDSASANAALTGIYGNMMSSNSFASGSFASITVLGGISSDELINYSTDIGLIQFYQNTLTSTNGDNSSLWDEIYQYIYTANLAIAQLSLSQQLSPGVVTQLTGEAKFVRAFCNFYLVNLYGPIPLITTTNYLANEIAIQNPVDSVYNLIINDLQAAATALPADFSASAGERVRPNQWAARFLLSRVYLYLGRWQDASDQASAIIGNTATFSLVQDLDSVFLANSTEAIWQLKPVLPGYNTNEGATFILTGVPYNYSLTDSLVTSFSPADNRRISWVDSIQENGQTYYYPFKYKVASGANVTEYSMVFRLAEMYLVRAEAKAELGDIPGAQADLDAIRSRAGLPSTTAATLNDLLAAVLGERRHELFTEWGHRWLDLKRTNMTQAALSELKAPGWSPHDTLYPIPQTEIQNDPNLLQNAGY